MSWVEAVDPDRDLISVELAAPPVAGAAGLDGQVNRSVQYSPPANANGAGVGVFALRVRGWDRGCDVRGSTSLSKCR